MTHQFVWQARALGVCILGQRLLILARQVGLGFEYWYRSAWLVEALRKQREPEENRKEEILQRREHIEMERNV